MLQSLPRQGHLSRITTSTSLEAAGIWADMLMNLPEEQFKFALNAAMIPFHIMQIYTFGGKRRVTLVHSVWRTLKTLCMSRIHVALLKNYNGI